MWIPETMAQDKNIMPFSGKVVFCGGSQIAVSSLDNVENAAQLIPYGVMSVPPKGSNAVVIPFGDSVAVSCIGEVCTFELQEGEIGLFSLGGASLILKNDGSVIINGRIFNAEE